MKSKLFILSCVLGMSFLSANGTVDGKTEESPVAIVEVNAEEVVAVDAKKEVAAEEAAKAKKAEESKAAPQDKKSCTGCK